EESQMKYKIMLSTATAIGLALGASATWAGSNNQAVVVQGISGGGNTATVTQNGGSSNITKFTQDGSGNTATVEQNGNTNRAGTHLRAGAPSSWDPSEARRGDQYITQNGDNNTLSIEQTGNGN